MTKYSIKKSDRSVNEIAKKQAIYIRDLFTKTAN